MVVREKQANAAQWLLLGVIAYVGFNILDRLGNIFAGLGAPGASDSLPAMPGQSYPDARYLLLAERIYAAAFRPDFGEDEEAIIRALAEMKNDADVVALFNAYGSRSGPYLVSPGPFNLVQTVRAYLSPSQLAAVNVFFHRHGITAQF